MNHSQHIQSCIVGAHQGRPQLGHKLELGPGNMWVLELELELEHMLELGLEHMWVQVLGLGLEHRLELVLEHRLELVQEHRLELVLEHMMAEEQVCSWGPVARQGQQLPEWRRLGSVGQVKE